MTDIRQTDTRQRLVQCFANVFPELRPDEIPAANVESLKAWDSVAHITLLTAIAEEFGLELEPEEFEELVSFELIADYLERRLQS
jgi:acyl carrier protein